MEFIELNMQDETMLTDMKVGGICRKYTLTNNFEDMGWVKLW